MSTELSLRLSDRGCLELLLKARKIRLEVGYLQLPASKPSALINGSSVRMQNEKHSTPIQCSDFQLRNLYPNLEMYWEPEVFNHCKYLSKVLLCCVHKSRIWPCASPSDLDALHFALLSYFFMISCMISWFRGLARKAKPMISCTIS